MTNLFAEERNRIDQELEKALSLESNQTTAGMVRCENEAFQKWDAELNVNYKNLTAGLPPEARITLKAAQIEWIKYRDLEYKNIDSIFSRLQGSMYIPMNVHVKMEIVRTRALELKKLAELAADQ